MDHGPLTAFFFLDDLGKEKKGPNHGLFHFNTISTPTCIQCHMNIGTTSTCTTTGTPTTATAAAYVYCSGYKYHFSRDTTYVLHSHTTYYTLREKTSCEGSKKKWKWGFGFSVVHSHVSVVENFQILKIFCAGPKILIFLFLKISIELGCE